MTPTDIGAQIAARYAASVNVSGVPTIVISGGAGDGVAMEGAGIDTQGYKSISLVLSALANLTDTKVLTLAVEYQESDDNSTFDTAVALQAATTLLTGDGVATYEFGTLKFDLNLRGGKTFKRYIRFNFTPVLDNGSADLANVVALAVMGGADVQPPTGTLLGDG